MYWPLEKDHNICYYNVYRKDVDGKFKILQQVANYNDDSGKICTRVNVMDSECYKVRAAYKDGTENPDSNIIYISLHKQPRFMKVLYPVSESVNIWIWVKD